MQDFADQDARLFFPATERNREPIKAVLQEWHRSPGLLLEIGSGSGEHAAHIAPTLDGSQWQPSDPDPAHIASINAWRTKAPKEVLPALQLDVLAAWPKFASPPDTIFCANVIHISPPAVTPELIAKAGQLLAAGGRLILYGPFREGDKHTAPSNEKFELWLKEKDPEFGIKDRFYVRELASKAGLAERACIQMPANNMTLVFEKTE